jgi:hypothetical protein
MGFNSVFKGLKNINIRILTLSLYLLYKYLLHLAKSVSENKVFVGYCRIPCSDNHSITHKTTIFIVALVIWSGVGSILAQLPRLLASLTGFSPEVLTAGWQQGCCDVKRTPSVASNGVPLDTQQTVKWRGARSAASDDVPLDVRLTVNWRGIWLAAGCVVRSVVGRQAPGPLSRCLGFVKMLQRCYPFWIIKTANYSSRVAPTISLLWCRTDKFTPVVQMTITPSDAQRWLCLDVSGWYPSLDVPGPVISS